MSAVLKEAGKEHVVLEKGRVLEQWRSKRWDSFKLNTPVQYSVIYGQKPNKEAGFPPERMSIPRAEYVEFWLKYVKDAGLQVREGTEATSVTRDSNGKIVVVVKSEDGGPESYVCSNLINCCGNYQLPRVPAFAQHIPSSINQLQIGEYTNPAALKDGAVLVVGGGQAGVQLAEEIIQAGKKVFLATSFVPGSVRSYRGEDIFFWMERIGFLGTTPVQLPAPAMRFGRIPITGNDHAISHHSLARAGATLFGKLEGVSEDGKTATFVPELKKNVGFAMETYAQLPAMIEGWIQAQGKEAEYPAPVAEPEWEVMPCLMQSEVEPRTRFISLSWTRRSRPHSTLKKPMSRQSFGVLHPATHQQLHHLLTPQPPT